MRLERRRPAELSSEPRGAAVVIDVLRMTSTAAVLMRRPSCARVAVAATTGDLARLSLPASDCVVVSELAGPPWQGAWMDNSPAQVSRAAFGERTPVLVTTNGTRALFAAAACAADVLLASFVDLRAVARHVAALAAVSVVVVPAGDFATGEPRLEDDLCASALESLLAGREPDLDEMAAAIRADPRVRRRAAREAGFQADLDVALEGDPAAAVLAFQPLGEGVGQVVRA